MAVITLLAFFVLAVTNWVTVAEPSEERSVEYVAKPAALAALLLFACTGDAPSLWLVAALALSLLGDVYLMLPGGLFVAGLSAFLLAHVAYVVDFEAALPWRLFWLLVVGAAIYPVGRRIAGSIKDESLRAPVVAYIAVISLMVASAIASASLLAIVGAVLFAVSDSLLAWNRFVQPLARAQLYVMVTYHLGQLGLVLALRGG